MQYNIKKKEEIQEVAPLEENPLMRKKKTPEELAAEAEMEDEDELTSKYNLDIVIFFKLRMWLENRAFGQILMEKGL